MKYLFQAATMAAIAGLIACSPKNSPKAGGITHQPAEPATWDTLGKPVIGEESDFTQPIEYTLEEPREIQADTLAPYNPSHTFEIDLLHTKVELSFDWAKKRANGKATLTMRPWFYATDQVTLDAKNFDIHSITFEGGRDPLRYDYDSLQLTIHLGKTFTRTQEFKLVIDYTAKPDERSSYGGSTAITNDKGLYFINADGSDKNKPRQIWTQGETESNSFWMPTVDKPNERCTQEMYLTVDNQFKTLSNGILVSSKPNADGTRTDYWKMDKPHAPYLFMMAIGDYAVVKDKWRGIDVEYYVEPKYEPDARAIYPYTTEMLEFFSKKLDYPYPWSKFSQVVVRDYVSGAMENTTAVIFGEFMQKTKRELLDNDHTNEKVVAHEMFHQWFGDLVTTESWANLTLNEGFANYSEYLWLEEKHGRETADAHLVSEQQGYLLSAGGGGHPLIHYGYDNREDMFDAHSYNKGGCILHMLRHIVGDEAFFAALSRYLKKNEYSDVEAHELRLAFEDVTGQDLNWFFNQWFFSTGHPEIEISYSWDPSAKKAGVTIAQSQSGANVPYVFQLPLAVDIYDENGNATRKNIRVTKRSQTFYFDAETKPALINVDANKTLLCVKHDQHSPEEWAFQYRHAPLYIDRQEALENLVPLENDLSKQVLSETYNDKSPLLRAGCLTLADPSKPETLGPAEKMAESDPDFGLRGQALGILAQTGDSKYAPIFEKGISADQPYSIVTPSLMGLYQTSPEKALQATTALQSDDNETMVVTLASIYAEHPKAEQLSYFLQKSEKIDGFQAFQFYTQYTNYLVALNDAAAFDNSIERFKAVGAQSTNSQWRRFAATKALSDLKSSFREKGMSEKTQQIEKMIEEIRNSETDATLKEYYKGF